VLKRDLTTGDLAKIFGLDHGTVRDLIDNGTLAGYRIPGSKERRVSLRNALELARAHAMEAAVETLQRLAIARGIPLHIAPALLLVTPDDHMTASWLHAGFDVSIAFSLLGAGVMLDQRRYAAVLLDCVLGTREVSQAGGLIRQWFPAGTTILCCLAGEDCADPERFARDGFSLTWQRPCDYQAAAAQLWALLRRPTAASKTLLARAARPKRSA
jgi:hypothetical protein